MKPTKESSFSQTIIYTQILGTKTLLVVDSNMTLRYLDIDTLDVLDEQKINIYHERHSSKLVSFSSEGNFFALIDKEYKCSKLYDKKANRVIAKVDRHQGEVSCVAIDPKDRYMFSCGDDGITYAVDIKSAQLSFTLPPHKDFVTDIAFSKDAKYVATSSYDKNISIYNLAIMAPKDKLKAHSAPVLKVEFLDNHRLFSLDKKNSAIVWDINSSKVIARLKGIHDEVTSVVVTNNGRFLFLGTKLGYILVYDLFNYEQISKKYIKLSAAITSLSFDELKNSLIICTDGGELLFYNIFYKEESLDKAVEEKNYAPLASYIRENPLLKYTKTYRIFENLWEKTVQRAKLLLQNSEKEKAVRLFDDFTVIASKNQKMQKLILEYAEYDKFLAFIKSRKFALAYALAQLYPLYKQTRVYRSMEEEWKKDFELAKKYMLDKKLSSKANEILAPYRGVSEKTALIQEFMLNLNTHKRFKDAIASRKFKLAFDILKQNPSLKECPEYKALVNYSDNLYMKAELMMGNQDLNAALKIFRVLLDFEDFKNEAREAIAEIEAKQRFFSAVKDENSSLAYNIMDEFCILKESQEGKKLQSLWESNLQKADKYAENLDVNSAKKVLANYMNVKSKNVEIANIFSKIYIKQLHEALKENIEQRNIEIGIKNYILYFGLTEQIENYFEAFKVKFLNSKLNIKSQKQGSIESWRPSMIVNNIL